MTAQELVKKYGCEVELALEVLGLAHSSYYYHSPKSAETELAAAMQAVAGEFPTYGTRRMTQQLRREPYSYSINRKRVQRIMRQKGWLKRVKRAKIRTTNSDHPYPRYPNRVEGLIVTQPDQVWVVDITYIRLGDGFVYLAVVLDVFTRSIRGWNLSRNLDVRLSLDALQRGLKERTPQIHHSDQGIQYAAREYIRVLEQQGVQISMAAAGKPEENGYAERLMRTIKEEEVDLSDYRDFADAERQIRRFLEEVYMTKRIHSALGYLTPLEFETAFRSTPADALATP
jgi:transposase InsO family protein